VSNPNLQKPRCALAPASNPGAPIRDSMRPGNPIRCQNLGSGVSGPRWASVTYAWRRSAPPVAEQEPPFRVVARRCPWRAGRGGGCQGV
jgi:hypothetical protein